jgi:hypothetical protein
MTEVKRCRMGSKSAAPCQFVATEPDPHYGGDEPAVCALHAADEPLHEEINEYGLALEKVERYLKKARRDENTVLIGDLERLRADYRERLDFFYEVTNGLRAANRKVTVYPGV